MNIPRKAGLLQEALEQAPAQGYFIDAENNVVINAVPALLLAIEPPPH